MLTTCGQHHKATSRSGTASCIRTSQENVKAGASLEPDVPVRSGRTRGNPRQQITKVSVERRGLDDRTREWHMSRAGVASHIQAHRTTFPRRGAFVAPSLVIESGKAGRITVTKKGVSGWHIRSLGMAASAEHFAPNDALEADKLDLQHHLFLLTFERRLGFAPPNDLDWTGIWCIDFGERKLTYIPVGAIWAGKPGALQ